MVLLALILVGSVLGSSISLEELDPSSEWKPSYKVHLTPGKKSHIESKEHIDGSHIRVAGTPMVMTSTLTCTDPIVPSLELYLVNAAIFAIDYTCSNSSTPSVRVHQAHLGANVRELTPPMPQSEVAQEDIGFFRKYVCPSFVYVV